MKLQRYKVYRFLKEQWQLVQIDFDVASKLQPIGHTSHGIHQWSILEVGTQLLMIVSYAGLYSHLSGIRKDPCNDQTESPYGNRKAYDEAEMAYLSWQAPCNDPVSLSISSNVLQLSEKPLRSQNLPFPASWFYNDAWFDSMASWRPQV